MASGGSSSTRLYTRTGDRGETGLAGGVRLAKDAPRIRAFGSFDEVGAQLGLVLATLDPGAQPYRAVLERLQHELFIVQAELAAAPGGPPPAHSISQRHVNRLESEIDQFTAMVDPMRSFVLPRGHPAGAQLHVARTLARRAERELVALHREEPVPPPVLEWANRLGDLLYAMALALNRFQGFVETPPDYTV
ncbi:MAG TPA: cob(I)yrinic acid a,c-diamide adenosyltransferase [Thermoplasmata archaeon]|nr:cob(I)yrinic acid a,c-diamide adenosyltransferase [Thermoplasmata archaeon]